MSIRYYTDEHIHPAVIRGLRSRNINVKSAQEVHKLGVADEDHLMFAMQEQRVIITQDTDFLRLHTAGKDHAGIVYAPQTRSVGELIRGCTLIYSVLEAYEMMNHIEFL